MTRASWLRRGSDMSLGVAGVVGDAVASRGRRDMALAQPIVHVLARRMSRVTVSSRLARSLQSRGELLRAQARTQLSHLLDQLLPVVLTTVLQRMDLTAIVHEKVDLDRLVKDVDIDALASRLDVDAVASRLDLDAVVQRVDLDAAVQHVDLDAVVKRVDIDTVVERLDLTRIVLERVDLARVVQEVLAKLDLVGIAEYVVDAIDLPQIIRESSGALASDTIQGIRMRGVAGDRVILRVRNRLRHTGAAPDGPEARQEPGVTSAPQELP